MNNIHSSNCPFAEIAFKNNEVKIIHGGPKEIIQKVNNWDDKIKVVVVIPVFGWFRWFSWCLDMEKTFSKKDLIAIPNGKDKYILIQRLKELVLASDKLEEETDYYKIIVNSNINTSKEGEI